MSSRNCVPGMIAGGNINTSVFCTISAAADNTVLQGAVGNACQFISQVGTELAPIPNAANAFAAVAGDTIELFGFGDYCLLTVGAAVTAGDPLKSNSTGQGITATSVGTDVVCAYALQSAAASGIQIRVWICSPHYLMTAEV